MQDCMRLNLNYITDLCIQDTETEKYTTQVPACFPKQIEISKFLLFSTYKKNRKFNYFQIMLRDFFNTGNCGLPGASIGKYE